MRRLRLLVLGMILCSTTLAAQHRDPGFDPGSGPLAAGIGTTVVPIIAGVAMMMAGKGDWEHGPTTGGFLLASGGLLLGPSIGDWAGGLGGRGFARFGLRTVALFGGLTAGVAASWNNNDSVGGAALVLGGLGIATGLAVWDLATLKGAVRRHNERAVSLMPILRPDTHALGVSVHTTF